MTTANFINEGNCSVTKEMAIKVKGNKKFYFADSSIKKKIKKKVKKYIVLTACFIKTEMMTQQRFGEL